MFQHGQKFVRLGKEIARWNSDPQLEHKTTCEFTVYGPSSY